jgi:hypothetical protein
VLKRSPRPFVAGVADGLYTGWRDRRARAPIAPGAWKAAMLCQRAPTQLDDVAGLLPAPDVDALRARARQLDLA